MKKKRSNHSSKKSQVSKKENLIDGLNSRTDTAKDRISDLENQVKRFSLQRRNSWKLWQKIEIDWIQKINNLFKMVPKDEKRNNRGEEIIKEVMEEDGNLQ